jgi:rSAM/selenodomain-associated transferase 2
MTPVTIVIPVYRDAEALERTLQALSTAAEAGWPELIVVSTADDAASLAPLRAAYDDVVWLETTLGRAHQMNAGAARATGRWLIFLHADTRLPAKWRAAIDAADRDAAISIGCFRFALDSASPIARVLEAGVRLRVQLFGLPYGDQALFVRREDFAAAGGFADLPIMEDVDLVRRFRRRGRLFSAPLPAVTSARKWERDGWLARTARHVALILLYFAGVPPERLAQYL